MARRCTECAFCNPASKTKASRSIVGRSMYYCTHPCLSRLPVCVFRNMDIGFIGLGAATAESKLTLKTHPRWCPMELFRE